MKIFEGLRTSVTTCTPVLDGSNNQREGDLHLSSIIGRRPSSPLYSNRQERLISTTSLSRLEKLEHGQHFRRSAIQTGPLNMFFMN